MNEIRNLYSTEPQYVWNTFEGEPIGNINILPCGLPVKNEPKTDITVFSSLSKGRVWYNFNTEVFRDTPTYNTYNNKFFTAIQEQDFSLSLLTTSKSIMKHINILQKIRNAEAGVWFSSDNGQNNSFTERLDILRRLYFSDIYTIAYLNTEEHITDILNMAELVSGLCHKAYLYGKQNSLANAVTAIFEEHKKTVFYIEETNNALLL
jgi:hypothetical protein